MRKTSLNQGWEFMRGEPSNFPGMQRETKVVDLPHDFMVEGDVDAHARGGSEVGFYHGGVGTYTKVLELAEKDLAEVRELDFEGCFGLTKVLVNGHPAGRHRYGYTPFTVNIRPFVKADTNKITVIVHNDAEPNSRWYPGSGLYRGVNLLTAGKLHIAQNGIFVTTRHLVSAGESTDAAIRVEVTLCGGAKAAKMVDRAEGVKSADDVNENGGSAKAALLVFTCRDKKSDRIMAMRKQRLCLSDEETMTVTQDFVIEDANLWSPENPALYEMRVELFRDKEAESSVDAEAGAAVDMDAATFGIRTISVDAKHGFMLNGKSMKLKGGCIHHDNGILGAKSFRDAELRKVLIHKQNGYNALRLAHNPQSASLLDACDELGMIVIDEAFDVWNMDKDTFDFSNFFADEWQQELRAMLLRDRNHPSVCFWSIGNELSEQGGLEHGYETSSALAAFVREHDTTRPVCGALCSFFKGLNDEDTAMFWKTFAEEVAASGGSFVNMDNSFGKKIWPEYTAPFVKDWDVVGYNYLSYHYESSHEMFPERVICATESKPGEFEEYWGYVEKLPYLIGDFLWTSWDYIGEAGIGKSIYTTPEQARTQARMLNYAQYPYRLAQAGDFDLCGNVKPQGAYHRIIWGSDETYIFSHNPANHDMAELIGRYGWSKGGNHWTWHGQEGNPVKVEVYSGAEEVELWQNGKSLGRKPAGKENHNKAVFELTYEPGTLEAASFVDDREVSRDKVATVGTPAGVRITMEKEEILADGQSLAYGLVEIVDADGNYVPTAADVKATASVISTGMKAVVTEEADAMLDKGNGGSSPAPNGAAAYLAGFGTGRAATEENYTTGCFTSYEGRWQIIVRAGYEAGEVEVKVEAQGLGEAKAKLAVH